MVAGDHDYPDTRLSAFTKGFRHFGSRRIFQAGETSEDEVLFQMLVLPLRLQRSIGQGNDPQSLFGHGFLGFKNPFKHPALSGTISPFVKNVLQRGRTVREPPAKCGGALWKFMYQSEPHTVGVEGDLVQLGITLRCGQGLLSRVDERDLHGVP